MAQEFTGPTTIRPTWFLVANRAHAHLFESEGGCRNLKLEQRFEFPKGRLKNREIDSDRASGVGGSIAGNFAVQGGVINKNRAHEQMAEVFAKQLADHLKKGLSENKFERLVLVAECRFLGEIKNRLDERVKRKVVTTLNEDIASLAPTAIRDRLARVPTFKLTG